MSYNLKMSAVLLRAHGCPYIYIFEIVFIVRIYELGRQLLFLARRRIDKVAALSRVEACHYALECRCSTPKTISHVAKKRFRSNFASFLTQAVLSSVFVQCLGFKVLVQLAQLSETNAGLSNLNTAIFQHIFVSICVLEILVIDSSSESTVSADNFFLLLDRESTKSRASVESKPTIIPFTLAAPSKFCILLISGCARFKVLTIRLLTTGSLARVANSQMAAECDPELAHPNPKPVPWRSA